MSFLKDITLYLCYLLILIWIFVPIELFFKLIVILFITGTTIDELAPIRKIDNKE